LATSLITVTAFATNKTFRNTVISLLYPIYSSGEIVEFEKYPEENSITASGLQDMVIKYEDVMYAFSTEGYVLVMDGGEISTPWAQIVLSSEDLETLLNIFSNYGI
jgi:hypothetical protein